MSDSPLNAPGAVPSINFSGPLRTSLAANLLGVIFAAVFFGITTVQTYYYFNHYSTDSRLLKGSIFFLWLLDALHLGVAIHFIYFSMVTNFASPAMLAFVPVTALVIIVTTAIAGVIIRLIFTWRMWRLNNRWSIAILINALSFTNAASSLYMTGKVANNLTYAYLRNFTWAMYLNFCAEIAADALIAGSLSFSLWTRRTGIRPTDSVLKTLMVYTVSTGASTCIIETATLITFSVSSDTSLYNAIYFSLPKILLNALLVSLNARERLRRQGQSNVVSLPLSAMERGSGGADGGAAQERSKIEFMVETHIETSMDPDPDMSPESSELEMRKDYAYRPSAP